LVDRRFIIAPGMRPRPGMMYHFEGTFARPEHRELKNGIIGDATKATREKGEQIVTRLTNHVADLIEDIRQRYPVGVKPLES
jgi:creatinine amidohydrolase/Fe(II)-dependent formamide hydrolase-like protein